MKDIACPLPWYFACHAVITLIIAVLLWPFIGIIGALATGVAFYAGREIAQWQSGLPFDWKGILASVGAALAAYGVYLLVL
jgi:hypothetical protein